MTLIKTTHRFTRLRIVDENYFIYQSDYMTRKQLSGDWRKIVLRVLPKSE